MHDETSLRKMACRIEHDWKVLENVHHLIERADTKASLLFGLHAILMGFLITNVEAIRGLTFAPGRGLLIVACMAFLVISVLFLTVSVLKTLKVVRPRMGEMCRPSLIFAGHIDAQFRNAHEKFSTVVAGRSDEKWAEDIECQVVDNSRIAVEKMLGVQSALRWSLATAVAWLIALVLLQLVAQPVQRADEAVVVARVVLQFPLELRSIADA